MWVYIEYAHFTFVTVVKETGVQRYNVKLHTYLLIRLLYLQRSLSEFQTTVNVFILSKSRNICLIPSKNLNTCTQVQSNFNRINLISQSGAD